MSFATTQDTFDRSTFLRLVGTAVALCATVVGFEASVPVAAAMILAIFLFAAAERLDPLEVVSAPTAAPIRWPRWIWPALAAGVALCCASAGAIVNEASLATQHLLWGLGLAVIGVTAIAVSGPPGPRLSRGDWMAGATLVAACGGLFFLHLTSMPPEIHGDEAETALDALRLLEEADRSLFSTSWFALPIVHAAPTALGFILFGPDLFGLRMTSALIATGSVVLLFAVVRRLAGTQLALLAALVLAGQRYFIHLARAGYHYVDTPFLGLLAIWLMLRLWQDRRASSAIWCGVALGIGLQTYFASRLVPLLLALTTFCFAARAPRGSRRRYLLELGLVAIIAFAVAAPFFAHFVDKFDEFWGRTQETSIFNPDSRQHLAYGYGTSSLAGILKIQFQQAISVFHFAGDTSIQYGYQAPLLDILSGILFLAGVGALVAQPLSPLLWLCAIWIVPTLVLGGVFTIDTPFYPRLSGIVPFVALAVAVGLQRIAHTVACWRASATPQRRAKITWVAAALLVGIVLALNAQSYFRSYAPNHRHSPMREIAEWIRDQGRGAKTYMFDQRRLVSIYHGTISFLAGPFAREDVHDFDEFLRNPSIDRARSRFVIMNGSEGVLPFLEEKLGPLEVEPHPDAQGLIRFHTARPAGAEDFGLAPRPPRVALQRAGPWLALIALLVFAAASTALWRRRRQPAPPRPVAAPSPTSPGVLQRVAELRLSRPLVAGALALVVLVGGALRFVELEQLPAGFYCDEAGNVYNAASIWRVGRDENGSFLPLYIWSFDTSYKNPVFIYAATIPVALFGPGPFAARFTAAAFGIAAVIAIFCLGRAIAGNLVGLFAALFLAVIPWHLHFSRIAFELISFPTMFLVGATALVAFANGRRTLIPAAVALGVSLYTYVPAKMFVPLFLAGYAIIYRRELWQRRRETIAALVVLALVALPAVAFDISNQDRSSRYLRGNTFVTPDASVTDVVARLAENYTHFFSPIFLFHSGDRILRHAVRGHGELYPVMAPFLLLGLLAAARKRSRKTALLLIWLALYPLAAAFIKREIPSASRAIIGAPAFCLLAALGADWLWRRVATTGTARLRGGVVAGVSLAGLLIVLGAQVIRYWEAYSEDYPIYTAKYFLGFQYGHEQAVDYFLEHYDEYDRFLLSTTLSNQPEIFLRLFAGLRQPPSNGAPPFEMPAKMDRGTPHELQLYRGDRLLFAALPEDLLYFGDYEIHDKIVAPDGTSAFLMTEVREPKDFIHVWMVAGPYPAGSVPPLPEYEPASPPELAPGGLRWQRYQLRRAAVLLDHLYGSEPDEVCAWAVNFVHSQTDQTVNVYAGFDDAGEIWVNGEKIPLDDEDNPFSTWVDTSNGTVHLREGRNGVAVKTCDIVGGWLFYFRLAGDDGKRVPGIEWEYVFEEGF